MMSAHAFRAARRGGADGRGRGPAKRTPKDKDSANMKSEDTRNLFLAIALSVLVMAAWQYFYAGPLYQREHQAQMQANRPRPQAKRERSRARRSPATPRRPARPAAATPPGAPGRDARRRRSAEVLAASPRVTIDTPSIGGSIDLKGGKIDDIILKDYRETIDPKSPNIRLFSPPGAPDAYWAETGFVSAGGAKTPNLDTVWTADGKTLTADQPVTLTWDNGAGLIFKRVDRGRRQIHVHDHRFGRELRRRAGDACSPTRSSCATAGRTSPAIRCCMKASSA